MAAEDEKSRDFYAVLGLHKESSAEELRAAYKKLAKRWHPDRCSASGNSKYVEEAKQKFQAIQEAYSVLSDKNKRLLYDVGVYDCEDDEENEMGDFLSEMAAMMSQTEANGNEEESFEELQELFEEMFQSNMEAFASTFQSGTTSSSSSTSYAFCVENTSTSNKRNSSEMNTGRAKAEDLPCFDTHFQGFCFGAQHQENSKSGRGGKGLGSSRRRNVRKQKISSGHDVSNDYSSVSTDPINGV